MRIHRSFFWAALVGLTSFGALLELASCNDLPDFSAEGCGNGIINQGEDCDGNKAGGPVTGFKCGLPGTREQCRYTCEAGTSCIDGYACGLDLICRSSSVAFEPFGAPLPPLQRRMTFADVDGDRRNELLALNGISLEVNYFDQSGNTTKKLDFRTQGPSAIGQLTASDQRADFVYSVTGGLVVMRGQADRSFAPMAYASFFIKNDVRPFKLFAIDARPATLIDSPSKPGIYDPSWLGDELLGIVPLGVTALSPNDDDAVLFPIQTGLAALLDKVAVGDLVEGAGSPCEEFVLGYKSLPKLEVYTPCAKEAGKQTFGWNPSKLSLSQVALPGPAAPERFLLGKLDGDAHLDLLIRDQAEKIFAAYGDGAGQFFSQPGGAGAAGQAAAYAMPGLEPAESARPLGIADLNGDKLADFVLLVSAPERPSSIRVYESDPSAATGYSQRLRVVADANSDAELKVVDLNGDQRLDLVLIQAGFPELDVFINDGLGGFNDFSFPAAGPIKDLSIGDFDGDLRLDVAFIELGGTTTDRADALHVAFGGATGAPLSPVSMGQLGAVDQLVSGTALSPVPFLSASSDLIAVSSTSDSSSISAFAASGDRQLLSPFLFQRDDQGTTAPVPHTVVATAIGQFMSIDANDPDKQPDIAAIVEERPQGDLGGEPGYPESYLWLLPLTGEAKIGTATPRPAEMALNQGYQWHDAQMVAVRLGADRAQDQASPNDTLVIFVPKNDEAGTLGILVATPEANGARFTLSDITELPGEKLVLEAQPCVADLDRKAPDTPGALPRELEDIAVLTRGSDGEAHVLVFWNKESSEALDIQGRTVVAIPGGNASSGQEAPDVSFACFQADQDLAKEMVLLSTSQSRLAKYSSTTGAFETGTDLREKGLQGGSGVAAGDADGDGLEDLVISSATETRIYRAKPVIE